jgi:uncharacterized protein
MEINTSDELRRSNMKVVRDYVDAMNAWDFDALLALTDDNVVCELPYAPEGFPQRLDGRDSLLEFQRAATGFLEAPNLSELRLETYHSDPGEIVAEYRSDTVVGPMNTPYENRYISRFTVRNGKITYLAEFFDPIPLVVAMGGRVDTQQPAARGEALP